MRQEGYFQGNKFVGIDEHFIKLQKDDLPLSHKTVARLTAVIEAKKKLEPKKEQSKVITAPIVVPEKKIEIQPIFDISALLADNLKMKTELADVKAACELLCTSMSEMEKCLKNIPTEKSIDNLLWKHVSKAEELARIFPKLQNFDARRLTQLSRMIDILDDNG